MNEKTLENLLNIFLNEVLPLTEKSACEIESDGLDLSHGVKISEFFLVFTTKLVAELSKNLS